MTVGGVMDEILRDRIFYDDSGGGTTISGGEPLSQPEFVVQLLDSCRDAAIHTALDTCGFAPRDVVLAVAPLVDLFLYDLKVLDDQLHRQHTGMSNTQILENLTLLGAIHDNIWIRVPVVPGFNDAQEQLEATARFIAGIPAVRQVNLLPYHNLGSHKTAHGNDSVSPLDTASLSLDQAAGIFRERGLTTCIGG
jgi:pyruvate formate lyase activating enzyme